MAQAIIQVAALRVKVKSLAVESRIIRTEERLAKGRQVPVGIKVSAKGVSRPCFGWKGRDDSRLESLYLHRVRDVRREARAALLAYAFIRGMAYARVERPAPDNPPDLKRVGQLVEKYGCPVGGYPKYKLPDGVLVAWVSGTLDVHPFAREPKVATAA